MKKPFATNYYLELIKGFNLTFDQSKRLVNIINKISEESKLADIQTISININPDDLQLMSFLHYKILFHKEHFKLTYDRYYIDPHDPYFTYLYKFQKYLEKYIRKLENLVQEEDIKLECDGLIFNQTKGRLQYKKNIAIDIDSKSLSLKLLYKR